MKFCYAKHIASLSTDVRLCKWGMLSQAFYQIIFLIIVFAAKFGAKFIETVGDAKASSEMDCSAKLFGIS